MPAQGVDTPPRLHPGWSKAMARQHPDHIPVMCQMANGHTIINTKVHPIEYFLDDDVWADCLLKMRELYNFDGILCHKPCTVSGGGKSEISKSIANALLQGPVFVREYHRDMDQVEEILKREPQ